MSATPTAQPTAELEAINARVRANPEAPWERYRLGRELLRAGFLDQARSEFAALCGRPDVQPAWLVMLGVTEVRFEAWEAASAAFEQALQWDPDQADWNSWLGRVLVASGSLEAGTERLERAWALRPDRPAFAVLLVKAYLKQGRFADALALAETAQGRTDDPMWARLAATAELTRAAEARSHALRGVQAFRSQQWDLAIDGLSAALALLPGQPSWEALLARSRLGAGDLTGAIAGLERLIDGHGPQAAWLGQLGITHQIAGDRAQAIAYLRRAVGAEGMAPTWHARLAGLLLADGRADAAVKAYRTALAELPGHPGWTVGLAKALLAAGDHQAAHDVLAPLTNGRKALPVWRMLLGAIDLHLGRLDEALAGYQRALLGARGAAPAAWHSRTAALLVRAGRDLDAASELEKAVALPDAVPATSATLARVYWRLGRTTEALEQIERALLAEADPPPGWRTMGAEIRRGIEAGGSQGALPSPAFSDDVYRTSRADAAPAEQSPDFELWRAVCDRVGALGARRVLDIGCGPGQFAEYFVRRLPDVAYIGVDFSPVAIEQARARAPTAGFVLADVVRDGVPGAIDYDLVLALEVLEHVDEDLQMLAGLQTGAQFIGSVPSFDSFGHVRFFADKAAVRARYRKALEGLKVEPHALGPHSTLYLMTGKIA
jgi:tetratricopeptide (TPR) repeat protein